MSIEAMHLVPMVVSSPRLKPLTAKEKQKKLVSVRQSPRKNPKV